MLQTTYVYVLDKILIWAFTVQWCGHICMVWVVGTGTDGIHIVQVHMVCAVRVGTYGVCTSCSGTLCAVFHS